MGAQSDFISEPFVPSESYRAQQRARMQHLLAAGFTPEQAAGMFSMPVDLALAEDVKEP